MKLGNNEKKKENKICQRRVKKEEKKKRDKRSLNFARKAQKCNRKGFPISQIIIYPKRK